MARHRSAAQKAATRKMIAANKAKSRRRKGGGKKRHGKARRSRKTRSAAQKAATRKMIAANRAKGRRHGGKKSRAKGKKHRGKKSRRKNPGLETLIVNPHGGKKMAKRHGKKHHGKKHGRRRHHNPLGGGIGGIAMRTAKSAVPAVIAGFAGNFIESKFLGSRSIVVRALARVGMSVGAAFALKRSPDAAKLAMGALLGPIGGEKGTQMGGGVYATKGMKGIAEGIAAGEDDMGAILTEEMKGLGVALTMNEIGDDGGEVGDADTAGMDAEDTA